jgi:5-methyltetrahydropteroyltriglutamate--homocysteine methyltransferase
LKVAFIRRSEIGEAKLSRDPLVDGFFLEYDSPRAGDFSPLRFMPKDKFIRLGLVSSKTPALEEESALRSRSR